MPVSKEELIRLVERIGWEGNPGPLGGEFRPETARRLAGEVELASVLPGMFDLYNEWPNVPLPGSEDEPWQCEMIEFFLQEAFLVDPFEVLAACEMRMADPELCGLALVGLCGESYTDRLMPDLDPHWWADWHKDRNLSTRVDIAKLYLLDTVAAGLGRLDSYCQLALFSAYGSYGSQEGIRKAVALLSRVELRSDVREVAEAFGAQAGFGGPHLTSWPISRPPNRRARELTGL